MKNKIKPYHFQDADAFMIYLIECAIRDRQFYYDSIKKTDMNDIKIETLAEISAMKEIKTKMIKKL